MIFPQQGIKTYPAFFMRGMFLFYGSYYFVEDIWLLVGKLGQYFAIKANVFALEAGNEGGIGCSELSNCGIDIKRPVTASMAFFGATVAEGVDTGFQHGGPCKADFALATPLVAFGAS
jgi:hypothetical protein